MRVLAAPVLVAALAAAAPATHAAGIGGVIEQGGVTITIRPAVGPATGPEWTVDVSLDIEPRTDEAAARLGVKSLQVLTAIDCHAGNNQIISAEGYDQADLRGSGQAWKVSGKWVRPATDSFMSAVVTKVCAAGGPLPTTPGRTPVVTSPAAPAAPAATDSGASPAPPKPKAHPKPPPTVIARAETPAAPVHAAPLPTGPARAIAQIAAAPSAAAAQRALDAVRSDLAPPLAGQVEPITSAGGAKLFRANVTGFTSMAEAKAFCARVAKGCWVRPAH